MNIIHIGTDTWRTDHLGCYGSTKVRTPNLDSLAAEGVVFENVYAEGLPTIPHRRVVWTGKGILPEAEWRPLSPNDVTVPELLKKAGYRTGLIADLYHMFQPGMNFHRGFDSWDWVRGQENDSWRSGPRSSIDIKKHVLEHLITPMSTGTATQYLLNTMDRKSEDDYFCAQVCNKAVKWLKDNGREKSFLLWLEMFDPHEPWDAPPRFQKMYCDHLPKDRTIFGYGFPTDRLKPEDVEVLQGLYAAEIAFSDECIGRVLNCVEELGLAGDTVVIFSSDHGTHLGERGCVQKSAFMLTSKLARIPLIVRHPSKDRYAGKRIASLASAVDMAPTFLSLAGQKAPECMEGFDLWNLVDGKTDSIRNAVFTGMWGFGAIHTPEWHFFKKVGEEPYPSRDFGPQLFDLGSDPEETENVISEHPEVAADLEAQLMARFAGTREEQAEIVRRSFAESTQQQEG